MNKRTIRLVNEFNGLLSNYNQIIRILRVDKDKVILSNERVVSKSKLRNRMKGKNSNIYLSNFDIIYGLGESSKEKLKDIKSIISSKGGKRCQELYGNKIKNNLNGIGDIPWNKGKVDCQVAWNKGLTKDNDERMVKISKDRMGKGNPMYGKSLSYESRKKLSQKMKDKILKGEFTPNIHNSRTNWKSIVDDMKFRSSWEATFFILNPLVEYEKIRIPYYIENKRKIYITDFVDGENRIIYEIKPSTHNDDKRFLVKRSAAESWCKNNGYSFVVISEDYFMDRWKDIDFSKMDKKSRDNMFKMKEKYEVSK